MSRPVPVCARGGDVRFPRDTTVTEVRHTSVATVHPSPSTLNRPPNVRTEVVGPSPSRKPYPGLEGVVFVSILLQVITKDHGPLDEDGVRVLSDTPGVAS